MSKEISGVASYPRARATFSRGFRRFTQILKQCICANPRDLREMNSSQIFLRISPAFASVSSFFAKQNRSSRLSVLSL